MNEAKLKKMTITLEEFGKHFSEEDKKFIEDEQKYYYLRHSLRNKRKSLGLTQEKLSKLSKVPRTTIAKVESGSRNTTLETLMALAHSMGSTIEIKFT